MHQPALPTLENQSGSSRKRKEYQTLRRLTDFFARDRSPRGDRTCTAVSNGDIPSILPQNTSVNSATGSGPSSSQSSPAKAWMRLDTEDTASEVRPALVNLLRQAPAPSPIAAFPTANQLVIDTMLKEMLVSLHSSLHNDISAMFSALRSYMVHMGSKLSHVEKQMGASYSYCKRPSRCP